jgi:pimeloyl-ACP methyl ester carboxylesterase
MPKQFTFFSLLIAATTMVSLGPVSAQGPQPPGKLIDIGGHRLHLLCSGEGEPTVILESGLGGYSVDWGLVQPQVAKFTKVCSYDRASYAWSDPGPEPRGLRTSVSELHRLLEQAKVKPTYILVGQSWGGRIVRLFAHTYPQEVAGMALIDTFSEGTAEVSAKALDLDLREEEEKDPAVSLPLILRNAHTWAAAKKRQPDITDINEDPAELIRSTTASGKTPLGDRPLVVISAGRLSYNAKDRKTGPSLQEKLYAHIKSQAFLATLSRESRFVVARRSFHEVHLYEPDLVTDAILQVVMAVRSGKKLGSAK